MTMLHDTSIAIPVIAFFGACIGSFLNVLIYRLPRRENIAFPASHCPSCGATVKSYDNIPVISYFLLRGRCRNCSEKISIRYPIVEFATSLIFVIIFLLQGWTPQFIGDAVLAAILLTAAVIDYEHMIIPNRLTAPGVFVGFLYSVYLGWFGILRGFHGVLISVLILGFMFYLGRMLYKRDGIGMGDIKLALVFGLFFGPFWSVVTIILAIFIGAVAGVAIFMVRGRDKGLEIPFGPFLAAGGLLVIFFRPQIHALVQWYTAQF